MKREGGRFIVLEGLDGAGTTTQTERIASALRRAGRKVLTTREPSDGPLGTLLRQALTGRLKLPGGGPLVDETLALLFAADRTDHLAAEVLPALERGTWVISDRYVLSSLAYQGATLPMPWVQAINARARPADLTLFLDVGLGTAAQRRRGRGGPPELFDAREKQRRILDGYRRALRRRGAAEKVVRLDGALGVEEVTVAALRAIERHLGSPGRALRTA